MVKKIKEVTPENYRDLIIDWQKRWFAWKWAHRGKAICLHSYSDEMSEAEIKKECKGIPEREFKVLVRHGENKRLRCAKMYDAIKKCIKCGKIKTVKIRGKTNE